MSKNTSYFWLVVDIQSFWLKGEFEFDGNIIFREACRCFFKLSIKMSNNETPRTIVEPDTLLSESKKPDQTDQPEVKQHENESITPINTAEQITEVIKKETEIASEGSPIVGESVIKSAEEKASNVANSEASEVQQSTDVPGIQQQTIGAGDTCLVPRQDENANALKPQEETAITPLNGETSMLKLLSEDKKPNEDDQAMVSKLKEEVQKASKERDSYQKKLENTEKKLASLQASYDALLKGEGDEAMLRRMIDQLKSKLIQTSLQLEDRIRVSSNQEKQIIALNSQVASLKEVESLTKSLLQIRNMEVKHLQAEVDDMERRITEERERYNTMINKMDAAVKLNADLKKEYETQLCLFRDLREKYEEKVTLLSEEKRALETNTQPVPK